MRALWLVRANLTEHPGGDTTQILRTADALRARGVQVDLCSDPHPDMHSHDVVHLFHLDRLWENEPYARRLRADNHPAVLSTIYWPPDEFDRGGRAGWQGRVARLVGSRGYENLRLVQRWAMHLARRHAARSLSPRMASFRRAVQYLLESVAVLLPNSRAEQEQIEQRFGIRRPAVIVPNAADAATFALPSDAPSRTRAGVLCVGRIEPRKNQHTLIEALRGTDIPLTLVGQPGRYSRPYYQRCRQAAGPNVRFFEQQPPDVLCRLYQSARVHACVSWYETPGLASLEAALCGCALVVTPGGCTREYFADEAQYGQPDDPSSIRRGIETALATSPPANLPARIAREFTWDAAAERTLEAYQLASKSTA